MLEHLRARKPTPDPDPEELIDATPEQLAELRDTAVGRAFGITGARISRDGQRTVLELGPGPVDSKETSAR